MSSLYTQQDKNIWKTWLLMATFLCVVVALGWFVSFYYDNPFILYAAIGIALVMNIVSYWYSDKIALSLSKARPANKEEHTDLFRAVENISITAGLPQPRVYIIDDPAPNAFATGRNKEHAAVAVTTGLLSMMDKNELEGVIAHEIAHIGNRDILLMTVVVVLVGFVALLSDFFMRSMFFGGGRGRREGGGNLGAIMAIIGVIFLILSPIVAKIIQLAISRKREFLADATGALLTRYPEGLASALEKISGYTAPMRNAHTATAHLFISNPFGGAVKGMAKLFMTHPPVEERIKVLRHGSGM